MPRRKRRGAARARDCLRQFIAFLFSNVGVVVLVVAYTIAGAFMFQAIEGASEMDRVNMMEKERDSLAEYLWNITVKQSIIDNETAMRESFSAELYTYQRKIVIAVRRGWDGGRSNRQWSFSSAFLYSLTVITTIGYGHLSPRTDWGKVVTIFYSLLGMPLFLLYLTNVGELLARWCKCLYALICMCRGCPGFSRRRIVRIRSQLELSDPESIECPEHWRTYPYWHAVDYPHLDHRHPDSRNPDYRNSYYDCSNYRTPAYRYRSSEFNSDRYADNRYQGYKNHDRYPERFPQRFPYRGMPERIPLEIIPERIPVDRNYLERIPDRYQNNRNLQRLRQYQRRPDFLRSASMPQPHSRAPPRAPPRGWSEPARADDESSEFSYVTFDAQTITVPISVCVAIMVGYLMFGSMIFGLWEKWDQLDGAYFCFISLSSIGFGDFVPGERVYTPRIETSFIVCSMYLMLGMALVAMCFNLMQEQVIHYVAGLKRAVKRICRCRRCKR